jgi:signal transduction histidine kinase
MWLGRNTAGQSATPFLSILRDPSGVMTMGEAREAFAAGRFETTIRLWPQFGFTPDAVWVRVEFRSEAPGASDWLVELRTARMDELDWYEMRNDGFVRRLQAGNRRPRNPELLDHKYPVFPLHLLSGETVEVLLRVGSHASLHIPLSVWTPVSYAEAQGRREALFASFFGYMTALVLLSLVLSLFTRDWGYAIYSLSLVSIVFNYFINSGYYAWLRLPAVAWANHAGTIIAVETTFVLILVYLRYFFDLGTAAPRLDRWVVRPSIIFTMLLTAALLAGPYRISIQIVQFQALALGGFSMCVALVFWVRGNRVARFYFLGWVVFWVLFVWTFLLFRGVLPMPTIPEYPAIVSIAISMTLFFFAMADRVRDIRQRADQSRFQILELEQKVRRDLQEQARQQQQLIRDLHDGIGGLTANVGILAEIGRRDTKEDKARDGFQRISELASEGAAEVHGLMSSLETRDMQWPDFIVECRRQGELRLAAHGIAFEMDIQGDSSVVGPGLFPGMSLLRVFKEALTNVVKHAEAARVDVLMRFEPTLFKMTIRDNGKGVGGSSASGRGLANMEARIRELGGCMETHAGQGTELVFEIPLPIKPPEQGINENEASA